MAFSWRDIETRTVRHAQVDDRELRAVSLWGRNGVRAVPRAARVEPAVHEGADEAISKSVVVVVDEGGAPVV